MHLPPMVDRAKRLRGPGRGQPTCVKTLSDNPLQGLGHPSWVQILVRKQLRDFRHPSWVQILVGKRLRGSFRASRGRASLDFDPLLCVTRVTCCPACWRCCRPWHLMKRRRNRPSNHVAHVGFLPSLVRLPHRIGGESTSALAWTAREGVPWYRSAWSGDRTPT